MFDMTHSYVWHDTLWCLAWLICMRDVIQSYAWHELLIRVAWLIRMRNATHWYVRRDSFICVTWCIHIRVMTHSYMWCDSFMQMTRLIPMCDMTNSYVYDIMHYAMVFISMWSPRCYGCQHRRSNPGWQSQQDRRYPRYKVPTVWQPPWGSWCGRGSRAWCLPLGSKCCVRHCGSCQLGFQVLNIVLSLLIRPIPSPKGCRWQFCCSPWK